VELWTDRGNNGVYEPGEAIRLECRTSDDAYLLIYEVDSEGYVRMLYPASGSTGWVEGRSTLRIPSQEDRYDLVTQGPEGIGYVVAVASRRPFRSLPWYLRPYDEDTDASDYEGEPDDEQGVTREGRIVGDPFVAIERIRERVCGEGLSPDDFSSSYTTYYVGDRFRYPRYLCYDCHRPGYWAWWDGFDPYYASCPVFHFRINYNWWWGYPCWTGYVPYYVYVIRGDCPPYYRRWSGLRYSSWDGWNRWRSLFGNRMIRYKPVPAPPGYAPPERTKDGIYVHRPGDRLPPGFRDASGGTRSRIGGVPVGRFTRPPDQRPSPRGEGTWRDTRGDVTRRPEIQRSPIQERNPGNGGINPRREPRLSPSPVRPVREFRPPAGQPQGRWERPRPAQPGREAPRMPVMRDTPRREQPQQRPQFRSQPQAPRGSERNPAAGGRGKERGGR
jgi:hypothetical protein